MRKKQARPARRITSGPPEAGGLAGTSQEVLSSIWHSPSSSSTRIRNTPSTGKPDDSAGSPFCVSALQDAALVYHNNTPPLKAPKYESDDFERSCCAGECASFSRSQFAHYGSVNGNNSRFPTDCSVPIVTSVSGDQKPFPCQFTANGDSPQSSFDVSTSFDRNISSTDSESPLKCLERCVRTKSREEGSTFGLYRNIKPSASTKYDFRQSRRNTNSMQFRFGYGKFTEYYFIITLMKLLKTVKSDCNAEMYLERCRPRWYLVAQFLSNAFYCFIHCNISAHLVNQKVGHPTFI